MYVVGERAYVLLNNWYGYYGSRTDVAVEAYQGGLVLAIDISDPANPAVTGRAQVPGNIQTSRLTRGGGKEALFVAANNWNGETKTVVRSFAVSADGQARGADHPRPRRLRHRRPGHPGGAAGGPLRLERTAAPRGSKVAVIDISDPEGTMVEGASVTAAGYVKSKTNMDLEGSILRIASGGQWTGGGANYIQTFNVSDIHNPLPVDQKSFGDGQDLYATLFLPDKAFCVTYRRVDPFHAFEISRRGPDHPAERVRRLGLERLLLGRSSATRASIGIGMDDQNGRKLAASLYDITDLTNPNPLISRASIEFDYSWSEAQWDNRAFSVLEDAVVASAAGRHRRDRPHPPPLHRLQQQRLPRYRAGVQIFTFSATHPHEARRHGPRQPGAPQLHAARGRHRQPLRAEAEPLQHHGARRARRSWASSTWRRTTWTSTSSATTARASSTTSTTTAGGAPADDAARQPAPDHPARRRSRHGHARRDREPAGPRAALPGRQPRRGGHHDLRREQQPGAVRVRDPRLRPHRPDEPVERGSLSTDQIQPSYGYWYGGYEDCWDCGRYWYYGSLEAQVAGNALVFPARQWDSELLGTEHVCYSYPEDYGGELLGRERRRGRLQLRLRHHHLQPPQRRPRDLPGRDPALHLRRRRRSGAASSVDAGLGRAADLLLRPGEAPLLVVPQLAPLDLTDPDAPAMGDTLAMPQNEDDTSRPRVGHRRSTSPTACRSRSRATAASTCATTSRRSTTRTRSSPSVGSSVNIPGELILVDGATIYTRDFVWGENIVESALNRLTVVGSHAYLQARRRFVDQDVSTP